MTGAGTAFAAASDIFAPALGAPPLVGVSGALFCVAADGADVNVDAGVAALPALFAASFLSHGFAAAPSSPPAVIVDVRATAGD